MLVVVNGAFKSGSTWLREIVKHVYPSIDIPAEYQYPGRHDWVHPDKFAELSNDPRYSQELIATKAHEYRASVRDMLLSRDDVRVLNIRRDLKDTLVSHYYYIRRMRGWRGSFSTYYWLIGRMKAMQIMRYQNVWENAGEKVFYTSYESLKNDFVSEVRKIGDFLGFPVSEEGISRIREVTSIEEMRKNYADGDKKVRNVIRHGKVGEGSVYFSAGQERDLQRIMRNGAGPLDKMLYFVTLGGRMSVKTFVRKRMVWSYRLVNRM